jgi:hypothetical protein
MGEYRYSLETGSKKHICPGCGKKRFVRFIDNETKQYLPDQFGRCDREVNCGYILKPNTGTLAQLKEGEKRIPPAYNQRIKPKIKTLPTYIPTDILKQSRKVYEQNKFVLYLLSLFGPDITQKLITNYHLGSSNSRWSGATVFWFVDVSGNIRAGQVKLFDNSGHTAKQFNSADEPKSCTSWVHSIIKYNLEKAGKLLPGWLLTYQEQGNYVSCLFGEHLLKIDPGKPVAIVEAPATAIVASVYLPQFIWLAVGSLSYLTVDRCEVLSGRNVVLFPDISKDGKAFDLWSKKARELTHITFFSVSDLLEQAATREEKLKGLDLRDYLTRYDFRLFQGAENTNNLHHPDYILTINGQEYTMISLICISHLGERFENNIMVTIALKKGGLGEILFNGNGELTINNSYLKINETFNKAFQPGLLNGINCLVQILTKANL